MGSLMRFGGVDETSNNILFKSIVLFEISSLFSDVISEQIPCNHANYYKYSQVIWSHY